MLLAKGQCSVKFLLKCRRNDVLPRFICNSTKVSKFFGDPYQSCERRLQHIVLSKIIEDKFRSIARLERGVTGFRGDVRERMSDKIAEWVVGHGRYVAGQVSDDEIEKLRSKYADLACTPKGDERRVYHIARDEEKRVVETEEAGRVVTKEAVSLLQYGSNFKVARKVTEDIMKEVEVGVERLAYGERWRWQMEERRMLDEQVRDLRRERAKENDTAMAENGNQEEPKSYLVDDPKIRNFNHGRRQAKKLTDEAEKGLRTMKENLLLEYGKARDRKSLEGNEAERMLDRGE